MKTVVAVVMCIVMTGCGTVGGALSGAGADLQKAGEWIRNK